MTLPVVPCPLSLAPCPLPLFHLFPGCAGGALLTSRPAGAVEEERVHDPMANADRSWQVKGLCRGNHAHLFFPPSTVERKEERDRREGQAKAICGVCAVKTDCLDFALEIKEPYGIWGGLTETERRQVATRRAAGV
jgi:WhiB family redox-sensing transcriptional regulator